MKHAFLRKLKGKGKRAKKIFFLFCIIGIVLVSGVWPAGLVGNAVRIGAASVSQNSGMSSSDADESEAPLTPTGGMVPATFTEPALSAQYAVLIDASTGQVLYKKNKDDKAFPASITKIMTLLLAVENAKETDVITVSKDAVKSIKSDEAHIALQPGEQITMEQALNALMLASANDAANAIAEFVGGSQAAFAVMMTERAREIGAVNTNFTNANGLPDENHYTTAYDMALITKQVLKNETARKYFSQISYTMAATNLQPETRYFLTHHKMLYKTKYRYQYAFAGKTGYTDAAGSTLVTVADKDGRELICVSLKESAVEAYADAKTLLEFGYNQFEPLVFPASTLGNASVRVLQNGEKVGTASLRDIQDQTLWIPAGSGCTANQIQTESKDIDLSPDDATNGPKTADTALHLTVPQVATAFYEPAISALFTAEIAWDPKPTATPVPANPDEEGRPGDAKGILVTILKYAAGAVLALCVLYLLYVLFMMFKVGYPKKLWRKVRKNRKQRRAMSSRRSPDRDEKQMKKKNRGNNAPDSFRENYQEYYQGDGQEIYREEGRNANRKPESASDPDLHKVRKVRPPKI